MARQLYIPALGDKLELALPWSFTVKNEYRNRLLIRWLQEPTTETKNQYVGYYDPPLGYDSTSRWRPANVTLPCTLPTGTVLTVDRIYIRAGAKDFDSVTFRCAMPLKTGQKKAQKVRFFAALSDVNQIVC